MSHADIPEELRNLSADVLWALRPLEPDVGQRVAARHGYPVHTDMIRFWWRPATIPDQIDQLDKPEDRDVARKAYQYLMASEDSSYKQFVTWQRKVLRKHAGVLEGEWDRKLQLPRHALEEVGLECAVWPHLYPRTNMCETYVRQQDARRKERARRAPQAAQQQPPNNSKAPASTSSSSTSTSSSSSSSTSSTTTTQAAPAAMPEEEASQSEPEDTETEPEDEGSDGEVEAAAPLDFARQGRNSAKSAYLAKVLGPVLGYGATYDLFQFVYDLWLWSTVGAKKHSVDAPLRLAMQGYGFSPEYWQTRHAALVDTVMQLGLPTLFITIAPYECLGLVSEFFRFLFTGNHLHVFFFSVFTRSPMHIRWSFPYHKWVEDEAQKLLRGKLQLPVAETLHIAHVLAQAVQGLLTGANKQNHSGGRKPWKSHIFSAKDGSGRKTVVNFFGRLEYQDGKRRRWVNQEEAATQFYHGRGTVHLHLLVWLKHIETVKLEESISASVPQDNPVMANLVEGSQRSWTGSGWQKENKASHFDSETGRLHLHHSDSDYCKRKPDGTPEGIRAYIIDVLAALFCHVDVQMSDGRMLLLRYVSGYVPKFSDSFTTDWLNDQGSAYAIAKRVLSDYHPLFPEMALQLAMQWFPQCFAGGCLQRFRVPVPGEAAEPPKRVAQYLNVI